MYQLFPRPDRYIARCGHLNAFAVERRIEGAPEFMRGLRAAFISDVHVLRGTTRSDLAALTDAIAALSPHILLLGGDYSDTMEGARRLFEVLGALKLPLGGFGVIGNNDAEAWNGRLDELRALMARAGFEMLVNGSVRLRHNGGTLYIAGIDEYRYGRPCAEGLYPGAAQADGYRILLSHYPYMPSPAPDLMLCGHTHGGQFNLLGLNPFSVGFERLKRPRLPVLAVSGLHDVNGMKLLVSKGIGASRLQLRVGVRPETELLVFE